MSEGNKNSLCRGVVSPAHARTGRCFAVVLLLGVTVVLSGCRYPTRGQAFERWGDTLGWTEGDGSAFDTPQMRMGTMPFDTWYSPFVPLAADELGQHRYMPAGEIVLGSDEVSRGNIYTKRAGFVDIAHTRNSIDLTRFAYEHVLASLLAGREEFRMLAAEPDFYIVQLSPPEDWVGAEQGSDEYMDAHHAAVRIAGRLAYLMTTWHEVVTWYGYKGMAVVTEKPSAFSYDDAPSHMIGVEVAMKVLAREPNRKQFNQEVTQELRAYLIDLGAVEGDEAVKYMEQAREKWWDGMRPRQRVIHLGLEGEVLQPMVLGDSSDGLRWAFNAEETVGGRAVIDLFDVYIDAKVFEAPSIRRSIKVVGGRHLHPRTDFVVLRDVLIEAGQPE